MALSNIFREPRREITEQVIGVGVVGVALVVWAISGNAVGEWLLANDRSPVTDRVPFLLLGWLVALVGIVVALFVFSLAHAIGEGICDALSRRGLDPRPKRRY